jgi:predicted outer membrane lipoprotein
MQQQQDHLRRRRHRQQQQHPHAAAEGDEALRESLLARSASGEDDDGDHQGAATTTTTTTPTSGPLIVRPRPFSVIAFLSAVVERWLSVVWGLVGGGGGDGARRTAAAPTTVAGARRAANAASASTSSAAALTDDQTTSVSPGLLHLRAALAEPYRPDDSKHQDALLELWALAFGADGPAPPTKAAAAGEPGSGAALRSSQWQEMGWQGLDPATDFRGAGRFGLENLLQLGRRRPRLFRALLKKERGTRSAWEYPFCVAGLNLTFALSGPDVLGLVATAGPGTNGGGRRKTAAGRAFAAMVARAEADGGSAAAAAERAFDEVYAAAFAVLDAVWLERGAGYMEFGAVMAEAKARLSRALARCGGEEGDEDDADAKRRRKGGAVRAWAAAVLGNGNAGGMRSSSGRRKEERAAAEAAAAAAPGDAAVAITACALARAAGVDEMVAEML